MLSSPCSQNFIDQSTIFGRFIKFIVQIISGEEVRRITLFPFYDQQCNIILYILAVLYEVGRDGHCVESTGLAFVIPRHPDVEPFLETSPTMSKTKLK